MTEQMDSYYLVDENWDKKIATKDYWLEIMKAKQRFFDSSDETPSPAVRPEIALSWIEDKRNGLNPQSPTKAAEITMEVVFAKKQKYKLIYEACEELLNRYLDMANATNYSLEMFDENGGHLIGIHFNIQDLLPSSDTVAMDWCKEVSGTMGHFLAMKYKKPYCVIGPEMMLDYFSDTVSFCAPVFLLKGKIAGTLILSEHLGKEPWTKVNINNFMHSFALVCALAQSIENQLKVMDINEKLINKNKQLSGILESLDEAVLVVRPNGKIIHCNPKGKIMLQLNGKDEQPFIQCFLSSKSELMHYISLKEKGHYIEETITVNEKNYEYYINLSPIFYSDREEVYSFVIRFTPQNKINALLAKQSGFSAYFSFSDIIGIDDTMTKMKMKAKKFAKINENVLLVGESGVGKELFAQAMHNYSKPGKPFIALNCGALPKELLESELFGYEGGSFTGAEKNGRIGKIELANGGTLFLDEIDSMSYDLQTVLLRVLQDKRIMRIGGNKYYDIDFRLIAATNSNLEERVDSKLFRLDLYYRLSVLTLSIPPLRERGNDIILLAEYFIEKYRIKADITMDIFLSAEVKKYLFLCSWPGNIRQLENALIYAINDTVNGIIEPSNLPNNVLKNTSLAIVPNTHDKGKRNFNIQLQEKLLIMDALKETNYQTKEAAYLLGLSYTTLYRRLKKLKIDTIKL